MELEQNKNKATCFRVDEMYFYSEKKYWCFIKMHEKFDEYMEEAFIVIENNENVFVTGAAGTGKSFFLKRIIEWNKCKPEMFKKKIAVVAPTGVAAENVQGMTLHHFFGLQPILYLPGHKVKPNLYNLSPQQEKIVRCLDMLIIDEVSMVRCDLLDAVDDILRYYRNNDEPFGGVQIVMFGDLYQLEPVVVDDEWEKLSEYYNQPFFFCSRVLKDAKWRIIELKEKYRQADRRFGDLLDRVRVGNVTSKDLESLRNRYEPNYKLDVMSNVVMLTTHTKKVKKFNEEKLQELSGESKLFIAGKSGEWWGDVPTDYYLNLKVGARVMFLRNTDEYNNGTMGRVEEIYNDRVKVKKDNVNEVTIVKKTKWSQYEYRIDEENKSVEAVETATFEQIPLKLAWAVTIHKSQGLTFDEVVIDVSKAFACGQIYVALSRCKTLNGIHLMKPIYLHNILTDAIVDDFLKCKDGKGYVIIKDTYNGVQYEKQPLMLDVRKSRYNRIVSREMKSYSRLIKDEELETKLLKHDQGKLCVNDIFSDDNREWNYMDSYNGNFPFLLRQYKTVVFVCGFQQLEAEIMGLINVDYSNQGLWKFYFRIGKILSIK